MFQFPGFAPYHLYIQWQVTARLSQPRFRIQKSPDQCLIASFPEHIAGFRVFLRLSMPRHPPYTLKNLTTFIDHRQGICDIRKPILYNNFGRQTTLTTPPAGVPERVSAPFDPRVKQTTLHYRFDQPITDHNRQKRCSTISARSPTFGKDPGTCMLKPHPTRDFQTEDKNQKGRYRGGLFANKP